MFGGGFKNEMVQIEKLREGDGKGPVPHSSTVKVHYVGTFKDGRVFDSSRQRGEPFQFRAGNGEVIPCWDQAVLRMEKGQLSKITCPSNTAYGSRGAGRTIPPNTDL